MTEDSTPAMSEKIRQLIDQLSGARTSEAVQHRIQVLERIHRGIARAAVEGVMTQAEVERRLAQWTTE